VKSALQERAEIQLLSLIEMERTRRSQPKRPPWRSRQDPYFDREQAERRERESFRFCLEALASIGAVPESEIENWTARFESEAKARERWPEVAPDPETKRTAARLLENRLPPSDLGSGSERHEEAIRRFEEAEAAINISGAFSEEERAQWHERLIERVSPNDRGRLQNPPRCRCVDLERVVAGPPIRHDGLRITHVDLYRDGLVIHWHRSVEYRQPPGRELTSWERFQASKPEPGFAILDLADDVGTCYRWWPGPSHDAAFRKSGFVIWGSAMFVPAVPAEATHLLASREGNAFEISVTA
jgi:hypothetical protein